MIYGFHVDGSECHSRYCALKHERINQGMDTRPSAETEVKSKESIDELADRIRKERDIEYMPMTGPEPKFPPAMYSQAWFEQLTPEQQQALRDSFVLATARFSEAIAPIVQAMREAAIPALQALGNAFKPFNETLTRIAKEMEHEGEGPPDMHRDYEALDTPPNDDLRAGEWPDYWAQPNDLPPNAGSAT